MSSNSEVVSEAAEEEIVGVASPDPEFVEPDEVLGDERREEEVLKGD